VRERRAVERNEIRRRGGARSSEGSLGLRHPRNLSQGARRPRPATRGRLLAELRLGVRRSPHVRAPWPSW
jgi:hypothetical protein